MWDILTIALSVIRLPTDILVAPLSYSRYDNKLWNTKRLLDENAADSVIDKEFDDFRLELGKYCLTASNSLVNLAMSNNKNRQDRITAINWELYRERPIQYLWQTNKSYLFASGLIAVLLTRKYSGLMAYARV